MLMAAVAAQQQYETGSVFDFARVRYAL